MFALTDGTPTWKYELLSDPEHDSCGHGKEVFQENQRTWLQANGIWASLSSAERASLEKPVGSWSKQEISNGQWRGDALGVLLWPIQRNEQLLPCDQPMFGENLDKSFPPPSGAAHFIKNAKLRDGDEIRKAREVAELGLWRARTTELQKDRFAPPEGRTFQRLLR